MEIRKSESPTKAVLFVGMYLFDKRMLLAIFFVATKIPRVSSTKAWLSITQIRLSVLFGGEALWDLLGLLNMAPSV